jgi:hypothetical protein
VQLHRRLLGLDRRHEGLVFHLHVDGILKVGKSWYFDTEGFSKQVLL